MWKWIDRIVGWCPIVVLWTKDYAELLHQLTDAENKLGREEDYYQKLDAEHTDAQGKILDLEAERDQLKAERDQIRESYQRLLASQMAKNAMRRAQLEAYRMWFLGQRKDFLSLSKRFAEIAHDNGMQQKHVENLLKGVEDAGPDTESQRENRNQPRDHDHPGTHRAGQSAVGDRGAEVGVGDQAGSPQA